MPTIKQIHFEYLYITCIPQYSIPIEYFHNPKCCDKKRGKSKPNPENLTHTPSPNPKSIQGQLLVKIET